MTGGDGTRLKVYAKGTETKRETTVASQDARSMHVRESHN